MRRVGAVVADALAVERAALRPLPRVWPDTDQHLEVRASTDCFVRVGDVDYSVPPRLAGRRLGDTAVANRGGGVLRRRCRSPPHARSWVPRRRRHRCRRTPASCAWPGRPRRVCRPATSRWPSAHLDGLRRAGRVGSCTATPSEIVHLSRAMKAPTDPASRRRAGRAGPRRGLEPRAVPRRVLEEEVLARETSGSRQRVKAARLPAVKTLDDFDFGFQRSVRKQVVPTWPSSTSCSKPTTCSSSAHPAPARPTCPSRSPSKPPAADTGSRSPPPTNGSNASTPPPRAGAWTPSSTGCAASRCWSATRSATSPSPQGRRPVLRPGRQPLRTRLHDRQLQQTVQLPGPRSSATPSPSPPWSTDSCTTPNHQPQRRQLDGTPWRHVNGQDASSPARLGPDAPDPTPTGTNRQSSAPEGPLGNLRSQAFPWR